MVVGHVKVAADVVAQTMVYMVIWALEQCPLPK